MKNKEKPYPMPLHLLLAGIVATFLIVATVLGGIYLGTQTQTRFHEIESSWRAYSDEVARKGELLSKIWEHLGYGGIIHHFKNYVLRQNEIYLDRLEEQLADFAKIMEEYKQKDLAKIELENLAIIENTVANYISKIPIAKRAASEKWNIEKTDRLVKVDDEEAFAALNELDKYWRQKHLETTEKIVRAVAEGESLVRLGFYSMAALVLVSMSLFALYYFLQMQLRQTMGQLSDELNERRIAQQKLRIFQRAVEQSPATIIITDTKRKIEYVNRKFCELTGYSFAQVIGKTPSFLQSGEMGGREYQELYQNLLKGKEWQGVFHNKKKNGELYWSKSTIVPLREENGEISHFIGLGEDISEKREAREQMYKAQKMEAVGLLASGVAHDFNNILTIILGNIFLARQDVAKNSEIERELEQIEIAAKRAQNMVGQILSFARQQPGEAIPLRVGEAIREVIRLMQASILPNIKIEYLIENDDLTVSADPTRLHQIIMNLCSNAAEAIGARGGHIIIEAKSKDNENDKEKQQIIINIKDNGPGIAKEIRKEIFDPFFTTKRKGKGTGLGLSVAASLARQMGGVIYLKNSSDRGSEFEIILPKAKPIKKKREQKGAVKAGNGRILLIDDEEELLEINRKILLKMDYEVDAFTNAKEAIKYYRQNKDKYALVISDYYMPEMNGETVCKEIRSISTNCPIIIYTAYHFDNMQLKKYEPIKLLRKPIEPNLLFHSLQELISGRPD